MASEIQAVAAELGGFPSLGRHIRSETDLREAVREGLPDAVIRRLMRSTDLTLDEIARSIDLSVRSLQRRKGSGRLTPHESDRVYRFARAVAMAKQYLGDDERALRWLKRPNRALGGVTPLSALDTEAGARSVENVLGRIAYGGIG